MELSYYFYNELKRREDIDELLISLMNETKKESDKLKIVKRDESEEGEGDTLDIVSDLFSIETDLHYVKDTCEEYNMKLNFCLWINIYPGKYSEKGFLEFIGRLLNRTNGDAILIESNASTVLERRNNKVIVNNYFFEGKFNDLRSSYSNGFYKTFSLAIDNYCDIKLLKNKAISIGEECFGIDNITLAEDEDIYTSFQIGTNYFNIFVQKNNKSEYNDSENISLSIDIIYAEGDDTRLKLMMIFINRILEEFNGDCQLIVRKGYLISDREEYVLMERKNNIITINQDVEEKNYLRNLNF